MKLVDWIKIIATYGPNAILVFFVFITEKKIRTAINEQPEPEKKKLVAVYILNWFLIFGVAIFAIYAWKRLYLDNKPEIKGTILNLSSVETLSSTSADLYQYKKDKGNLHSVYDAYWRLVTEDNPWDDGASIRFTIQAPKPNSKDDDLVECELPFQSDFYEKPVMLVHKNSKLFLIRNGQEKELRCEPLSGNAVPIASIAEHAREWFPAAYAQTAQQGFPASDFEIGLESPDAIIRRKTRADLAKQNPIAAVPWMEDKLEDSKSSYRLKLGVLVALNQMPGARRFVAAQDDYRCAKHALRFGRLTAK